MTQDKSRIVRLLWNDHIGGTNNVTLSAAGTFSNSGGRHSGAFYSFSAVPSIFLPIDAAAGITNMRFAVNDELEDQGGLGFPLQDSVVISMSSCINTAFDGSISGRLDVAARVAYSILLSLADSINLGAERSFPNTRLRCARDVRQHWPPTCRRNRCYAAYNSGRPRCHILYLERCSGCRQSLHFLYRRGRSRWKHPERPTCDVWIFPVPYRLMWGNG